MLALREIIKKSFGCTLLLYTLQDQTGFKMLVEL